MIGTIFIFKKFWDSDQINLLISNILATKKMGTISSKRLNSKKIFSNY